MRIPYRILSALLPFLAFLALLGLPAKVQAQIHRGDAFFGYSRLGADAFYPGAGSLNGWDAALHIKLKPMAGIEADLAHYGMGANAAIPHTTTVLFGPRIGVNLGLATLFVHGLIGGEHSANNAGVSGGAMAWAFGGGADLPLTPILAWRIAADYIAAPTQSPDHATHGRFTAGLVFRF